MPPKKATPGELCSICKRKTTATDRALQCDLCEQWSHQRCENVKDTTYDAITNCEENEHLAWYCVWCSGAALPIFRKIAALEVRVQEIERTKTSKEEVSDIVATKIDEKSADIVKAATTATESKITPMVQQEIRDFTRELKDISSREDNVIIYKLKEDESACKDVALQVLKVCVPDINMSCIKEAKRIGEKKDDKDRPLLVKTDSSTKGKIMRNLNKLKDSTYDISITHDLPARTRQRRKLLIDQAKETTEGDQNDFLYRFVGPFGMETVKTVKKKPLPPDQ